MTDMATVKSEEVLVLEKRIKELEVELAAKSSACSLAEGTAGRLEELRSGLAREVAQLRGAPAVQENNRREWQRQRDEALAKLDRMADHLKPLRTEISGLHKRVIELSATSEARGQAISRLERAIADERRLKEHALETCEAMQTARDNAQRRRDSLEAELEKYRSSCIAAIASRNELQAKLKGLEEAQKAAKAPLQTSAVPAPAGRKAEVKS